MSPHRSLLAAAAVLAIAAASPAQATLVYLGSQSLTGTGIGAVNTVLTMQSPGSTTTESASVGRQVGSSDDVILGDAKTGASQTLTRTLGSLSLTAASDLRVVFNASEPGNLADQGITLSDLRLSIYGTDGALLFSSGAFAPVTFADTFPGTGNAGFIFGLDAAQAAQAQALGFGDANNRIGLSASALDATGGVETFHVANAAELVPPPVPEPATLVLTLTGLAALAARRRLGR